MIILQETVCASVATHSHGFWFLSVLLTGLSAKNGIEEMIRRPHLADKSYIAEIRGLIQTFFSC